MSDETATPLSDTPVSVDNDPANHVEAALDEAAQVAEEHPKYKVLNLLGEAYRLVDKLGLGASYYITKASAEENLHELVEGLAKLIHVDDRKRFLNDVLSDEAEKAGLDVEGYMEAMNKAMEAIAARPLDTSTPS